MAIKCLQMCNRNPSTILLYVAQWGTIIKYYKTINFGLCRWNVSQFGWNGLAQEIVAVSFQTDLQPLSGYKIEEIQTSYGYFC